MPKYYLLGGENTLKRDAEKVNQKAFNDAGESPSILVFPWARASFDNAYVKRKLIFDYFRSLGAGTVNFVDYSIATEELKEKISEANVVYLTGGVPSILIERLKNLKMDSLLENYAGVIVGRSAGALAVCRKCVITYKSTSEVKVIDGLGLLDLTLKVHYKAGIDEKLKELSKVQEVFAVPKGSAIIYDKGCLFFMNIVYSFRCGERYVLNEPKLG
jgi:dipeptidase E